MELGMAIAVSDVGTKKGARTNQLILDAAIEIIFEFGLPNFTFRAVAERVGLSRGALLHHFKDKEALLTALIGHIYRRRLSDLVLGIQSLTEDMRKKDQAGVDLFFQIARKPYSVALREIQSHARTERYLRDTLKREAAKYLEEISAAQPDLYPEWQFEGSPITEASLLLRTATEGFAALSIHSELEMNEGEFLDLMKFALRRIHKRRKSK